MAGPWCYVKVHWRGREAVVAICDEELLGKDIEAKGLRIRIDESFYGGDRVPLNQVWKYVEGASIVNAFGNAVVSELAKKVEAIRLASIEIGGVLHVQLILR